MSESNVTSEPTPAANNPPPAQAEAWKDLLRRKDVGLGAVIAVVVLIAFVAWVVIESTGESSPVPATATPAAAFSAVALKTKAAAAGQPVYWVGAEPNSTYEFTQNSTGVLVRYLPAGVAAGDATARLTIGTYPMKNAYKVMAASSNKAGSQAITIPGGGIAVVSTTHPSSVYVAYPKSNFQIEVYDPKPATALQVATSGGLQTVLGGSTVAAAQARGPVAATAADLRALAAALGHPVYWAGPRPNTTLELTQTASGHTYVRYLPPGVAAGSPKPYLTIATYPLANAYAVTKSATKDENAVTIKLPNNGIAVYTKGNGTNVHLAYQGSETQVEVYDPHPSVPPRLVSSGQVVAV